MIFCCSVDKMLGLVAHPSLGIHVDNPNVGWALPTK